jgi:hypothetical protein
VSGQQAVVVEGHRVPEEIVDAISRGEWKLPADEAAITRLFSEPPTASARLYPLGLMASETAAWRAAPPEQHRLYGGPGSRVEGYLTVDPRSSLLIGDLGFDMPVALDYSVPAASPRIVYLPSRATGWIVVARDAGEFLRQITAAPQRPA